MSPMVIEEISNDIYLIGYGDNMQSIQNYFKGEKFFTNDKMEIFLQIKKIINKNDGVILVKGANSLNLKEIIKEL